MREADHEALREFDDSEDGDEDQDKALPVSLHDPPPESSNGPAATGPARPNVTMGAAMACLSVSFIVCLGSHAGRTLTMKQPIAATV